MVRNYRLSHDDTAIRVALPQHLGIKTMDGRLKIGTILVDDDMVDIENTVEVFNKLIDFSK